MHDPLFFVGLSAWIAASASMVPRFTGAGMGMTSRSGRMSPCCGRGIGLTAAWLNWVATCGLAGPAVPPDWHPVLPMSKALRVARTASSLRGFQRDTVGGVIGRCRVGM